MTQGVLYIATGKEFVEEALLSINSLKNKTDLPVSLASDLHVDNEYVDNLIYIENPDYSFGDQIEALRRTPYAQTLALDTDIYVYEDPSDIFSILNEFDIAAAHAPAREQDTDSTAGRPPKSFPEYNTGVVGYNLTDSFRDFLNVWKTEYERDLSRGYTRNQPSFRRSLYRSDLRIATLPPEYNCRYQFPGQVTDTVKIFHGRLKTLNANSGGTSYLMDVEAVAKKINSESGPRVYFPRGNSVSIRTLNGSILFRFLYSLQTNGFTTTFKKVIKKIIG